ncbi:oligomeric Golgi complex protein 4 [Cryptosporidium ubiquitum]|uniref:Oligomeric Golgi complex protein 4 n=1 Tax=Cryptosporidium ubiquitum TaxID=857276 RepID=A0A1J4MN83_9CRYT|nr:oligomeric Golgi complex protein 4 [Cryptosporidium ubiquitum]OII74915.1 oligomeric Golgi complex protein 4 [Cryptosporidium ubiquitum]
MNNLISYEEGGVDASILLNSNNFSNVKRGFNASTLEIQNSLIACKKELFSMKNEVLINLENGLKCFSTKIESLPSTITEKKSTKLKLQNAIQIVNNIIFLKKCDKDFTLGMSRKDYEFCATCISKYLKIKSSCVSFEKKICEELDNGRQTLYLQLQELIEEKLSAGELDKAIYYAKLFVPIGMPVEGLERYIKYIRGNITDICISMYNEALANYKKTSEKINYADIFTGLFVSIINCIKEHQDKILKLFVTLDDNEDLDEQVSKQTLDKNYVIWYFYTELLKEINTQGSIIIDKFEKEYEIYLDDKWANIENIDIIEMSISHRELDGFLEEMSQICHLFYKFKVYMNDLVSSFISINSRTKEIKNLKAKMVNEQIPNKNNLFIRIDEMSIQYVSCEYGYIIYSINHALNNTDEVSWEDKDSLISTLVEDVFFLLHKTINRCVLIGNIKSLKLIIVHLNHILLNVIKQKIVQNLQNSRANYEVSLGNSNESISNFTLSHLLEIIKQKNENCRNLSNSMHSWTHSLNNLQACIENLEILSETIIRDFESSYNDLTYFYICIDGNIPLDDSEFKMRSEELEDKNSTIEYINKTIEQIISEFKVIHDYYSKISLQILSKISISPILIQLHEEISFDFSENESKDYSLNQSFVPALTSSLKVINEHLKNYYNNQSSEFILSLMIERIVQKIEHIVINYPEKKRFTIYGALVFENDVRNLLSYTNSLLSISIRHKFLRLLEICDILNITSLDELSDLLLTDFPSRNWHLAKSDILKTLFLKQDIDHNKLREVIKNSSHFFN